ncbi:MAG: UDP-4-amino-4,6-dideoxy-N-acetyl-beta-L-altrosamine transaminase [Deltaproteobacteria bacterium]|nr:UDP-4-amino-4,6-dideoxy-N-acetyl-beta-L-altrosamine transaminase [Deltaproteobacteria bacterium]
MAHRRPDSPDGLRPRAVGRRRDLRLSKLPYGRQTVDEDDVRAVVEVLRGDRLTQGPAVERFEAGLTLATGARHAVAVANGTVALHLACVAAGMGPGDEGITTPITFAASANCIAYCGAAPRFVDVEHGSWNVDPDLLEAAITARTKVLVPVHFAGLPCDMRAVRDVAERHGLTVIADACHALGATYQGLPIGAGNLAHMTCLSFHPVKHITTAEGGAVLTDDEATARALRRLRHHGIASPGGGQPAFHQEMQVLGVNGRLSDVHSALGSSQLTKLGAFVARRRQIAARYREAFATVPGLRMQAEPPDRRSSYHLFVIWLDPALHDRRRVYEELHARDILVQVHYVPVHLHAYYRSRFGTGPGQHPIAEEYYAGALSLPMYPALSDEDVERVIMELREILATDR